MRWGYVSVRWVCEVGLCVCKVGICVCEVDL